LSKTIIPHLLQMVSPELVSVIISRLSLHIGQVLNGCGCGDGGSIIKNCSSIVSRRLI
jgi:hypothetical protein